VTDFAGSLRAESHAVGVVSPLCHGGGGVYVGPRGDTFLVGGSARVWVPPDR